MQHLSLYRKYRPKTFEEVRGQEHIVSALSAALKNGTVSHAYLFCGSRGTGKTSIARIFARTLETNDDDLYEIDAASNRGIDDVRALREAAHTLPFRSKYKVYIIDEVHMLTKDAFNALLKTLEEPPRHVIFILATTEGEKLPETVVSRCQVFTFKKPSQRILKDLVLTVAKKEGTMLLPASADLIAMLGDGSFRDTHGVLEKVLNAYNGKQLSVEDVEELVGAPRSILVNALIAAVADKALPQALQAIDAASASGTDMRVFMRLVLQKMRFILLLRFANTMEREIEQAFSESDLTLVRQYAQNKDAFITTDVLRDMLVAYEQIPRAIIPQLPIELALMRLLGESRDMPLLKGIAISRAAAS
ncbi:MAG: DNA polymerase III, subunit gamma and tau [Parcubacteria group bacterium Gr01-1014_48]|nr:MAG: DNA polymerase III, subunit gamma and tau [Parcubacteria group bacterium Greene0416_14]TSC74528.1 MAG: DNA polymerase III, subunit gamma and tau [Parcubacteria group bacterium Gr01-1014_48]TSD01404.1 MAG: DNA polymerase III, subunit gamma and tau [Parcubacteria group bacterium Greene1014_15]TSD08454.1 MAG: DNA polymerase III, subunit gamma and tau [Parcubacteria group bacterium Greene0714_4]